MPSFKVYVFDSKYNKNDDKYKVILGIAKTKKSASGMISHSKSLNEKRGINRKIDYYIEEVPWKYPSNAYYKRKK